MEDNHSNWRELLRSRGGGQSATGHRQVKISPSFLPNLAEAGIRYSSSFRDDILPYRHQLADGKPGIVEIPVNFAFDDWNFGMSSRTSPRALFGREAVLPLWIDEFEATHAWGGVTTLVLHPQVSGRPMR